jgi:hypothetical protein
VAQRLFILPKVQKYPGLTKRFLLSVRMANDDDKPDCRIGFNRSPPRPGFSHSARASALSGQLLSGIN